MSVSLNIEELGVIFIAFVAVKIITNINMRSITTFELQYAHRFYGFQGEAQYLHGHTGVLTIEVEDTINEGVNMVYPCNEIQKVAWEVL